jgi:hypothetical protein
MAVDRIPLPKLLGALECYRGPPREAGMKLRRWPVRAGMADVDSISEGFVLIIRVVIGRSNSNRAVKRGRERARLGKAEHQTNLGHRP